MKYMEVIYSNSNMKSSRYYYFDINGRLRKLTITDEDLFGEKYECVKHVSFSEVQNRNRKWIKEYAEKYIFDETSNAQVVKSGLFEKITSKCVGMTKEEIKKYMMENKEYFSKKVPEKYPVYGCWKALKFGKILFRTYAETQNKNTFDLIEVEICMSSDTTKDDIKKCQKSLWKSGIEKIKESRKFKKYGIPIEYIKPIMMSFTKSKILILQFGLKTEGVILGVEES